MDLTYRLMQLTAYFLPLFYCVCPGHNTGITIHYGNFSYITDANKVKETSKETEESNIIFFD